MSELAELQSTLARILREALPVSSSWENPKAVKNLHEINQKLNGISSAPHYESIAQVVTVFRRSQQVESRQLKHVCYGAAMQMQDGWCVLGDDGLRDKLLAGVDLQNEARKRLKYFQALLSSYFAFARYDEQTPKAAHAGWKILRDWLVQQKTQFQRDGVNKKIRLPGWFTTLTQHENLLTNKPCDRYGDDMLRDDNSSIEEARQGLGIPGDSWVMQEVILSQMRAAVALGDDPFKTCLDALLRLVLGETEVKVSELLKRRAIALLISRYARCASKPEQPILRDAAVSIIGNPWLKQTEWDAWVKRPDGQPDDEARKMINGWLVRRWITDFFELLSADGQANQRRLNYWLRFVPAIEDLWFVVGSNAQQKSKYDARYLEVKKRADGRWLDLIHESDMANNAFVMRIGNYLMVEFGLTNNACFIYSAMTEPFSLAKKCISESNLKIYNRKGLGEKYSHSGNWEAKFDEAIFSKIGYRPGKDMPKTHPQAEQPRGDYTVSSVSSRSAASAATNKGFNEAGFWNLIKQYSLPTDDKRSKGGALWVCIEQSHYPTVDQWLEGLGFKYRPGRGWWRE